MNAPHQLRLLTIAGLLLTGFPSAFAQNWTLTSAPITNWSAIAMSADGSRLVAAAGTSDGLKGLIYFSTNGGTSWITSAAPEQSWSAMAANAGADKLTATVTANGFPSGVWTSTNSGLDWTQTSAPTTNWWNGVTSSADGTKLIVTDRGFYRYPSWIFISTNGGADWQRTIAIGPGAENLTSIASSADGTKCMSASLWHIYASNDSGQTWSPTSAAGNFIGSGWVGLDASADGNRWVAAWEGGWIYLSADAGMNWTTSSAPSLSWQAVASSADGSSLVAVATSSPIYVSSNSGSSWLPTVSPSLDWHSVASSADGCKLAATIQGGGIYTWQSTPSPKLNITLHAGGLRISWIVPSMPFVLQGTADLNTPDWTAVPMTPILNLTNLHHEVTVPLSGTNQFYRLQRL